MCQTCDNDFPMTLFRLVCRTSSARTLLNYSLQIWLNADHLKGDLESAQLTPSNLSKFRVRNRVPECFGRIVLAE
jgi:hypothetical protein